MSRPPSGTGVTATTADWRTAYACQGIKFSLYLAGSLVMTPLQRIFEADVCRNYYRDADPSAINGEGDVLEELCKVSPVQRGVSNINGLQSGISLVPSLFATLLYLALLKRINKKQMLLVNIFGFVLMDVYYTTILFFYNTFDPRWIVLTSLFNFVGGGFPVFNSIMPALIAESVPQDSLSSFQLYTTAIAFLVKIAGSSFSLVIMKSSLWFPVLLGLFLEALMVPLIYICFRSAMPLTKATRSSKMTKEDYAHLAAEGEEIELSTNFAEYSAETTSQGQSRSEATSSSVIWRFIRQHMTVLAESLLPCAIVTIREVGVSIKYILPFWESRRYHWELREVGWVHLAETMFTVIIITALPRFAKKFLQPRPSSSTSITSPTLPAARSDSDDGEAAPSLGEDRHDNDGLTPKTKQDASSIQRDLSLARICILLSCAGTILLSISWYRTSAIVSLAVFAGGIGFQDSYFSYLAGSMPEKNKPDLATVYMILSMATLAGFEIGGSMTSAIYSAALTRGGDGWETSWPLWFGAVWFGISWWVMRRHR